MLMLTKVVWREWYDEDLVADMEANGTLPRCEADIDTRLCGGDEVAALIAVSETENGSEYFLDGDVDIVIIEPAEFAGEYTVYVEYLPHFMAATRG